MKDDINKFLSDMRGFVNALPNNALIGVSKEMRDLRNIFQISSPKDTGRYSSNWRFIGRRESGSLFIGEVNNYTPYGVYLESGSIPGSPPWPRPGKRTAYGSDGNIYSTQAIYGDVDGMVNHYVSKLEVRRMTGRIADQLMTGLS